MTSGFHGPLDFRDLNRESTNGKLRLMLLAALLYSSACLDQVIVVPASFVTDLGSVPRFLWSLLPPIGRGDGAFVLHDWLYQAGGVTRQQADAVLYEAMRESGVGIVVAWTFYRGCRLGGWLPWRRYRKMAQVEGEAKAA